MVAITHHGCQRLRELGPLLPTADIFISNKFKQDLDGLPNQITEIVGRAPAAIASLFGQYDQLIFIFSIGAAVRMIAPCLKSKEQDPGVIVIDDAGRFVVPVLSGHLGGANACAERVANLLNATVVLTTASESLGTLPIDILGRELGWRVEAPKINQTRVAANTVNGEAIAFVQEAGSKEWWTRSTPLPKNITLFNRFEEVDLNKYKGVLWVTDRTIDDEVWERLEERLIVYRPPQDQS